MDFPKLFCKINTNRLDIKSKLKGVYFTKPRLVAFYDVNYDNVEPARKIFYFKEPNFQNYPIDLNIGYRTYVKRKMPPNSKALEFTLKYAMSPKSQNSNCDKIKVFAQRGTLIKLMNCCHRNKFTNCIIRVSRYDGDLYMVHVEDGTEDIDEYKPMHTHHGQLLKNVFTESFKEEPNIHDPIDENKLLIGVHQSSLGGFEIIYQGEIQGILSEKEIENFDDLEILNACRFVMVKQMWHFIKRNDSKYFRYWLQAYLANVSDIYFAYKGVGGIVRRPIVHKSTSNFAKESDWKPGIYTEFLYEFLQRVNDLLTNDNINSLKTVYEIYFVDSTVKILTYKVFEENAEKVFITKDYMDYCKQL